MRREGNLHSPSDGRNLPFQQPCLCSYNKIIISVLYFSCGHLLPLQILSSSFCIFFPLLLFNVLEILISLLVQE